MNGAPWQKSKMADLLADKAPDESGEMFKEAAPESIQEWADRKWIQFQHERQDRRNEVFRLGEVAESESDQLARMRREALGMINKASRYQGATAAEKNLAQSRAFPKAGEEGSNERNLLPGIDSHEPENLSRLLLSVILIIVTLVFAQTSNWYLIATGSCALWFVYEGIVITKGAERP